ncbi:MAG: Flp pilus assembly protein CpaB [Pseudomonadota bacterium]
MAGRGRVITMIILAVGVGGIAAFGADSYLARNSDDGAPVITIAAPTPFQTIVVADQPLRFGTELNASNLTEIPWPEDSIPDGAFATVEDVTESGRRVVLAPLEANEPVLSAKISGPGGRAGLANIITEGMRATTIRVNDVAGVAGFILPGDRVDVVWTRDSDEDRSLATVIQQNVRVLTIDQLADERAEDPRVVSAVTLEVNAEGAQRLTLASATGQLSLVLRGSGDIAGLAISSVSTLDLDTTRLPASEPRQAGPARALSTVWVTHADDREQHSVPTMKPLGAEHLGRAVGAHNPAQNR